MSSEPSARVRRLAEELVETGYPPSRDQTIFDLVVQEVDQALRPTVHERRVQSSGSIVDPTSDSATWSLHTGLAIIRTPVLRLSLPDTRRFADGLSSWLLRRAAGDDEWLMFDRPAGSERDLVILADALAATIVQRHPGGTVRVVGSFGVLRTEGFEWHLEPPVGVWLDAVADPEGGDSNVMRALLEFAVHDLGAQGIGALVIYRAHEIHGPVVEERLPPPPALHIGTPFHLAALRHALGQIDGAAVFDASGTLRQLGVRLVPSLEAEDRVDALGGTRHTAGRRYSYDDPSATVIAVSEDGPVTVFRNGEIVGRSPARS